MRTLTRLELNRALLARQLLMERSAAPVDEAVSRVCALQAQYSPSPYIGLWTRLQGFDKHELTNALEDGRVVKATLMRNTLHLVSAGDYPSFAGAWLGHRRSEAEARFRDTGIDLDAFAASLADYARAAPRTIADLAAHARTWFDGQPEEIVNPRRRGGRMWNWAVRGVVPLVHVPPSGTWRFHGPARLAPPPVEPAPEAEGTVRLVERYLAAFGPASLDDLMQFTGVRRKGQLRPAIERLDLERYCDESGRELLDLADAPLPAADTPAPVRFLPKWDSTLLAHRDRTRVLPAHLHETVVVRTIGNVLATVLVDGFVVASWRVEGKTLVVEPYGPIDEGRRDEILDEGGQLAMFVGATGCSFTS